MTQKRIVTTEKEKRDSNREGRGKRGYHRNWRWQESDESRDWMYGSGNEDIEDDAQVMKKPVSKLWKRRRENMTTLPSSPGWRSSFNQSEVRYGTIDLKNDYFLLTFTMKNHFILSKLLKETMEP
ncbi:hypothetical protein RJT34_13064 [Clitoria ternatea]|uniref:Uncharacterized protein n=1 Tax=Clitoria ternatea TaxID=43366 RepID=A0AAN9JQW8_CLITE